VDRARATLADGGGVLRGDVAHMRGEAVVRVDGVQTAHRAVADDLGHDGGGRDGGTLLVAVHNGLVLGRAGAQAEAVHQADLGRGRQLAQDRRQAGEIARMQPDAVDLHVRHDADGDALGAADDGPEELLPSLGIELLGVVQKGERADAMVPEGRVVEQDARYDERTCKRSASGFVCAGE
jgi:hypothetical protein